jgi:hypothetical protein
MEITTLSDALVALESALQKRLDIIADHAWRDADAAAHLQALQDVSTEIFQLHEKFGAELPAQLQHFLTSQSYAKALAVLRARR